MNSQNALNIITGLGEEIIQLPVMGQMMNLKWVPGLFSAIIPTGEESSILVYDGMKLEIQMSSLAFSNFISDHEIKNLAARDLEIQVKNSFLTGAAYLSFNDNSTRLYQLIEMKWDTSLSNIKKRGDKLTISCESIVAVSYLKNDNDVQEAMCDTLVLKHDMSVNRSVKSMAEFIIKKLSDSPTLPIWVADNGRPLYSRSDDFFGKFHHIRTTKGQFRLYETRDYGTFGCHGAALEMERSRYGNILNLRAAEIQADAAVKAAKIPHLLKVYSDKKSQESLLSSLRYSESQGACGTTSGITNCEINISELNSKMDFINSL